MWDLNTEPRATLRASGGRCDDQEPLPSLRLATCQSCGKRKVAWPCSARATALRAVAKEAWAPWAGARTRPSVPPRFRGGNSRRRAPVRLRERTRRARAQISSSFLFSPPRHVVADVCKGRTVPPPSEFSNVLKTQMEWSHWYDYKIKAGG